MVAAGTAVIGMWSGAWASCGTVSCPFDTTTEIKRDKGAVSLDLSYQYIDQTQLRSGGGKASAEDIAALDEREISTLTEIRTLQLGVGISSRLALEFSLPLVHREHQHARRGTSKDLIDSWNFNGLGDAVILARYAVLKPKNRARPELSLLIGEKLPTGKTTARGAGEDDAGVTESRVADVNLQPGSGSFDHILGASSLQELPVKAIWGGEATMPLFFSATYRLTGRGTDRYKVGNTLVANAGTVYPLSARLGFSTQVNLRSSARDKADGHHADVATESSPTGGLWVYVSPGLQLHLADGLKSYIHVQLPVYQDVKDIQLVSRTNVVMGFAYEIGSARDEAW